MPVISDVHRLYNPDVLRCSKWRKRGQMSHYAVFGVRYESGVYRHYCDDHLTEEQREMLPSSDPAHPEMLALRPERAEQ